MAAAGIHILIGRILSLIENEISLYEGVQKEVEKIRHELLTMKSFLEDTKSKGAPDSEVWKIWVANVRDMAHDVEEIVDEFNYHLSKQQSSNKFTRTLWKFVDAPKTIWVRSQIGKKLQEIKVTIREIAERHQRYGRLGSETSQIIRSEGITLHTSWVRNHAESSLFMKDDDLVGIKDVKEKLMGLLFNEDQTQRTVISVVGMGGSGKTTLVANIFNSQKVRQYFDCYAWITVSQTYTIEELLRNMIKELYTAANEEIPIDLRNMSYRQLAEILMIYLQSKRYFVVLDDVWNIDLWREINVALTSGLQGSRVVLTTRKEEVAAFSFGVGSQVHHVQPLGKDEAWDLFCRKAFSAKRCPPRLEFLARGLVEKCKGLPLGIVTLGGVMSTKLLEFEWRRVYNSFNWELSNNPMFDVLRSILLLSFNDLPYQLKHCFLYCCMFPEDYVIFRNRLIRLWIAEGFVEQIRGLTLEETAENYLTELIRRNVLQVVINSYGKPKACKMHDILRELALSISEMEKFCNVFMGQQETTEEKRARRISLHADNGQLSSFEGMAKVRTFFAFLPNMITSSSLNAFPSGFKMLKILELKRVPIHVLPYEIAYCYSLNYLNLKKTKVKQLPKSITKLRHLQTLDVRESEIKVLPHGIAKLKSLRHLITYRYGERLGFEFLSFYGIKAPSSILELENLQVLFSVEVGDEMMIKRLRNMTQLTKLGITKVRGEYEKDMCLAIEKMKLLLSLLVMVSDVEEVLRMEELSSAPPLLDELILVGKLEKIPFWFNSLGNLTSLQLRWSRLAENFLHCIQELPNLADLRLYNACEGSSLCFLEGFQKLVRLRLFLFPELNEIIIEKGVMPHIQILELGRCYELKTLPHGIEHLSDLRRLNLLSVSNELIQRVRGVDRPKILHISNIDHVYETQSGWCRERLS